jgi:hypothetical protein
MVHTAHGNTDPHWKILALQPSKKLKSYDSGKYKIKKYINKSKVKPKIVTAFKNHAISKYLEIEIKLKAFLTSPLHGDK